MASSAGTSEYSDGESETSAEGPSWGHSQAATIQRLYQQLNLQGFRITCLKQDISNYEQITESLCAELTHQDNLRDLEGSKQYHNKCLQSESKLAQVNFQLEVTQKWCTRLETTKEKLQHELKRSKERCLELDKGLLRANRELTKTKEKNERLEEELKTSQAQCTKLQRRKKRKARDLKKSRTNCWEARRAFREKELELNILTRGVKKQRLGY